MATSLQNKRILVTGGSGFIGSALVRDLVLQQGASVLNYDLLTYAAVPHSLDSVQGHQKYRFVQGDVADGAAFAQALQTMQPDLVMHLAAESHVDRSIDGPAAFVQTNLVGTFCVLEQTRAWWEAQGRPPFLFHHISTDEVFGSLGEDGLFAETTAYDPSSPYSASKAGSDHLVRAWHRTYGLPVVITNCSNNYGPYQFPEKLIPLMIQKALAGESLPVYGDGGHIRDWLYVDDHVQALETIVSHAAPGSTWNVGGNAERTNLQVVHALCAILDEMRPRPAGSYRDLVAFVQDRPGHDRRYAIDASKLQRALGWRPSVSFETGLRQTVAWYLDNPDWIAAVQSERYDGSRLGTTDA